MAGESSGYFSHPIGLPIDIIPEANPSTLKPGSELLVQVLFRGKPASDLQIEMAWLTADGKATRKIAGKTNAGGRLLIPVASAGIWKLHTVLKERCKDIHEADWESFWTSLTFEVKQ